MYIVNLEICVYIQDKMNTTEKMQKEQNLSLDSVQVCYELKGFCDPQLCAKTGRGTWFGLGLLFASFVFHLVLSS